MKFDFDVIVIGGGHAGCEAAHAAAKMGANTALITLNPERIGFMSCNPAMGGLAKGQLIKEIDALGGVMGINTDKTAIQFRRLNESKGPAVRSSRAQCDKKLYAVRMQEFLRDTPRLGILGVEATEVVVDSQSRSIKGLRLKDGSTISARAVILTTGTFLRAIMHTGFEKEVGGRAGDQASNELSASLEKLGFKLTRLKTGTPPRLHKDSIDWSVTEPQPGDKNPIPFSFYYRSNPFPLLPQISCHITYTNELTHVAIEENFDRSPMFTGVIQGIGPRYCPSIEDKVKRFRDKERHQIFLEPEGLDVDEIYVNGISTSLPQDVQDRFVRTIRGCENARFIRYGYAVEYDAIDARQLKTTYESKDYSGLFFAGQVNGTSGYEEAGAQGLMAGINAAQLVLGRDPFTLTRGDGYVGVLTDDLVTKGTDEPYRMFTSRAEFRLLLREDNADLRLSEMGWKLGLLSEESFRMCERKRAEISQATEFLRAHYILPKAAVNDWLAERAQPALRDRVSAEIFLRRPEVQWGSLAEVGLELPQVSPEAAEQAEIQVKYQGYIQRDLDLIAGVKRNEAMKIPEAFTYEEVSGLSNEIRGRFKESRPETIGQASRIQGVTPAALANLMIHLKMRESSAQRNLPRD